MPLVYGPGQPPQGGGAGVVEPAGLQLQERLVGALAVHRVATLYREVPQRAAGGDYGLIFVAAGAVSSGSPRNPHTRRQ